MKAGIFLISALSLAGCKSDSFQIEDVFLGEWKALSRNHLSISGNVEVTQERLIFEKQGEVSFKILNSNSKECILEIEREVDHGEIMRMALREDGDLEVAYYETIELATKNRTAPFSHSTSWGLYVR